jgi:DNA topoisomerase-6 subunit B
MVEKVKAEELALKQREISISEFFAKNRHLLGFDNPTRALLTAVKEAVDNSLDACEEARILPEIIIRIEELSEERFKVSIEDNGPGIVKEQIPRIFGKLLYGSRFHTIKMTRGQQGLGISAAGLYGQLTTGKPISILSKISSKRPAHFYEIIIDTQKNEPVITKEEVLEWKKEHGTRVEIQLLARYIKGDRSVDEYLKQTALANPHVRIIYKPPFGDGEITYERVKDLLPPEPKEIKPHPYGVELGNIIKMLQSSRARSLKSFLLGEFSRVSPRVASEICQKAALAENISPARLSPEQAEGLFNAINQVKIRAPEKDTLSPIGEEAILSTLKKMVKGDFYTASSRPVAVYRGNPFQIEVGLVYGIDGYPQDEFIILCRFANRVPLLYQQSACAITRAVIQVDWRNYGLQHPKDSLPIAPMLLMVHVGSVWVPFTSEAKEAIAHYPEIIKEIKLALQECGRRLSIFLHRRERAFYEAKRRSIFELYARELASSLSSLTGVKKQRIEKQLSLLARARTRFKGL